MNSINQTKKHPSFFNLSRLSIQQRLPLLICILLLIVITTFGLVSYLGVKNAALKVGQGRLQTLTDQLSTMLSGNSRLLILSTQIPVGKPAVKKYLLSAGKDSASEALKTLENVRQDTSSVLVQLLNINRTTVLSSAKEGTRLDVSIDSIMPASALVKPDSGINGKIFVIKGSMYYPVIVSVTDNKKTIGYLVRWRMINTTPKTVEQLSQLMGTDAKLYVGNDDGKLWTDMVKPVPPLPVNKMNAHHVMKYSTGGKPVIATVRPIPGTNWLVSVEMPQQKILEAAHSFLYWVIISGVVLLAAGIFFAWRMSRNITRPLNKLTAAASSIAAGNYSTLVEIDKQDELGKLANAFNAMALQVQQSQEDLEKKVLQRTAELQSVNKELEAFSYSVSHDLRAPLRAISGYSMILKEDYESKLDAEAIRIINATILNVKMMGQLIDDLIAFSQMGKADAMHDSIDMKQMAESVTSEILQHEKDHKYEFIINPLPSSHGNPGMIKQVWANLVGNAVKYSSKKSDPRIEIGYKENGSAKNIYYVKDNGVGFDMQYSHKLFGVFQRLHNQDAFEGTGVGLALVKRIIDKHDGEVWAESTNGQGATFYFSLPKV
ncbi:MAG: ATP-binding protein [Bacteroidota bacterium]